MTSDQIEKAIQLCGDLQAHTLNEVVKNVKAGQRLGTKDLRLIQDIKRQLEAQRTFAKGENGEEEWLPLNEAAKRLGVNVRTLQMWCSGKDALHQPTLPNRREGRRVIVPFHAAHAHLTQHAKRLALKKIAPSEGTSLEETGDADDANLPGDLVERLQYILSKMSQRLVATPHGLRLYSQTLKTLEEVKARREAVIRKITVEEAQKMLRSLGELFCEHVQHYAPALAKHMREVLRDRCLVDVNEHHCMAEKHMEVATCEWGNHVLDAIQKCVKEQVEQAQVQKPSKAQGSSDI